MMHSYDTYIWYYNTWLGCGKCQKMQNYFNAEAEEEAGFVAFVQLGKLDSCLPVQAEAG